MPAGAQDDGPVSYVPVTSIDLGVSSLNLSVGETYTFQVTYEPADSVLTSINWFVTDEDVISIDPISFTLTALSEGSARIFAESIDGVSYTICSVTVGSDLAAKDASVMKSGTDLMGLTRKEMKKITAPSIRRYIDFIADSAMDEENFSALASRTFDVLGLVISGTEEAESEKARALGLDSEPLPDLQTVTLVGTVDQILAYVKNNLNLVEITEIGNIWFSEPDMEEFTTESVQKAIGLKGNVDTLAKISTAHKLNLMGQGRTIAIIDTGIVSSHEQFTGRVVREACFSMTKDYGTEKAVSVCNDGATGKGAANPSKAAKLWGFNHGSHVAGIAAGRDGVAPKANIVFVAGSSEQQWTCKDQRERDRYQCSLTNTNCCTALFYNSNLARSYQYLIDLVKKEGLKIDVVNMSYGGGHYKSVCDSSEKSTKRYFDQLLAAGILPVVSAAHDSYDDAVAEPACLSNAYTVAALANLKTQRLADYSNYSKLVDIAAPGTDIYSAVGVDYNSDGKISCTKNCYGYFSGTSMAAPVVSGTIAIVKQLYPGKSPQSAGAFLKAITSRSVNTRLTENQTIQNMSIKKPILDLTNILTRFTIPDANVTASTDDIELRFDRIKLSSAYKVTVVDAASKKTIPSKLTTTHKGSTTILNLTPTGTKYTEGTVYRVEITRFIKGQKATAKVVKYVIPYPKQTSLTAASRDKGVDVYTYMEINTKDTGLQYRIYNAANNRLAKTVTVKKDQRTQTVTGLVNGAKYYVTVRFYRDIKIGKTKYTVWSRESSRVSFQPLSNPYGCWASWPVYENSVNITCTADPAANGITVFYRDYSDSSNEIKFGCKSDSGKFTCKIADNAIDRWNGAYQFFVSKYVIDPAANTLYRFGPTAVINRNADPEKNGIPQKGLIYIKDANKTAVVSAAESGSQGIKVLYFDGTNNVHPFCDSSGRSCDGKEPDSGDGQVSFMMFRWSRDANGRKTYSPGVFLTNIWSAH